VIIATEGERATAAQLTPTVQEAVKYIEENLCTVGGIDEICRELYISKSHLHHLFATELDTSPKKYILDRRLDRARQALATGERATEIYSECGFGDYTTFYRNYRSYFGHAPSETIQHV
jgi:AraC-like DNA-binding protein